MIQCSSVPYLFNVAIIKPLIKSGKKSSEDINNIRPVSVLDALTTIFETILLIEIEKTHKSDKKQFGFKTHASCAHAIFTLKQAIIQSIIDNLSIIVTAIDASKAFDKINRIYLWVRMFEAGIEPHVVMAFISYYNGSQAIVENENEFLKMITTTGCKQGGPASPRLFDIYIEPMITELEKLEMGVEIGKLKCEVIMYADDILLLANNDDQMQQLLDVVEQFGKKYQIKYNPDKTIFMVFNDKCNQKKRINLKLESKPIERVKVMRYLGQQINEISQMLIT